MAILNDLLIKLGDIILWNFRPIPEQTFINMAESSYEPRKHEIYSDTMHMTPDGYLLMATELFKGLLGLGLLTEQVGYGFNSTQCNELEAYKSILKEYYREALEKR